MLHDEIIALMRVLMFVPQYPYPVVGGLEKQSHELSKALVAEGIDVKVISGKILQNQPNDEVVEGVPVKRIPWSKFKLIRFLRTPVDIFLSLLHSHGSYDLIHLHQQSWVGLYVILIAKLLGKPIITKLPGVGNFGLPGLRRQRFGWLRLRILLQSDALIAMSAESFAELKDVGYSQDRVLLTPNGIVLNKILVPILNNEKFMDHCRVVFVGRLCEGKQLHILLDAWAGLCNDSMHNAILEIWGEGPLENELKQQSKKLCIASRVIFRGHVENVTDRLKDMDIFVLPSSSEGNSNAILEAMAAGLPIVSTLVGGTPMLVGDAGLPYLCPSGDIGALGSLLRRFIKDQNLRIATGLEMRHRAETYFDIQRVAQTYIKAYRVLALRQQGCLGDVGNPVVMQGT